jgi:hypothetical protein
MKRDDEVERIAMDTALAYETAHGREAIDVGHLNRGYDIESTDSKYFKRYIEVKGRAAADGRVMLRENEKARRSQLADTAWLYIVLDCKAGTPTLYRIQNPGAVLNFTAIPKGTQYLLNQKD